VTARERVGFSAGGAEAAESRKAFDRGCGTAMIAAFGEASVLEVRGVKKIYATLTALGCIDSQSPNARFTD